MNKIVSILVRINRESTKMDYKSAVNINEAHSRIKPFIHKTPVLTSQLIDEIAGCSIYFKCENFQKVGAFKMRGALNAVLKLIEKGKIKSVATHSSGNHAQALSLAARNYGLKAYIVMPNNAPQVKKDAVLGYGAEIIECEPNLAAREGTLEEVLKKTNASFVPPYNHIDIIEGQGTTALELLNEISDLDIVSCPVGGGGLLSGTILACESFNSTIKVFAGEPEGANDAFLSLQKKKLVPLESPNTIADGLLTSLGEINWEIISKSSCTILTVTDDEIVEAMKLIYTRLKIIVEPSSAVPMAMILKYPSKFKNKKVGLILSGGNVD
ncbi:MAG: threonine dehydratase, partial [Sphingobacteriales bacterium]